MPLFKIMQKVSHPRIGKVVVKESHMVGLDIRHATEMLPFSEEVKRDLQKKYWSRSSDELGRTIYVEITEEVKPK